MATRVTNHFCERVQQRFGVKLTSQEIKMILAGCDAELSAEPVHPEEDVVRFDVYLKHWDVRFVAVYNPFLETLMTAYANSNKQRYIEKQKRKGLRKRQKRLRLEGFDSKQHKLRAKVLGLPRTRIWN